MSKLLLFITLFFSPLPTSSGQQSITDYNEWLKNASAYQSLTNQLVGHSFKSVDNAVMVTQCSMACLRQYTCLSYNFDTLAKKCDLNNATHSTHPFDFKPSSSVQYYTRESYVISQKADPCLSLPCSNDGTCLSRFGNVFTCLCSPTWTGPYCTTAVLFTWADWSTWSDCSKNCGDGVRERRRACYSRPDMTKTNGRLCPGAEVELDRCVVKECPYWSPWEEWSGCSTAQKCGEGTSTRSRTCLNSNLQVTCFGLANESRICQSLDCDAQTSIKQSTNQSFGEGTLQMFLKSQADWLPICSKNWTQTNGDVACKQMGFKGGAYSSQFIAMDTQKSLNVDFQCQGQETNLVACPHSDWTIGACGGGSKIVLKCVVDGRWSTWGEWAECSVTCADGVSLRVRNCTAPSPKYGGQSCPGDSQDTRPCTLPPCPGEGMSDDGDNDDDIDDDHGDDDDEIDDDDDDDTTVTSIRSTPVDGTWLSWNAWSSCNVTCGGGGQTRVRFCVEPKYGGSYCNGSSVEANSCNTQMCPVDGIWQSWNEWSSCSVSCGGGKRIRKRSCTQPKYGGKDCPVDGATSEDFCNDDPCKIDGQWSLWSRWMDCSVTCGTGSERRYRDCSVPENGGNTCEGKPEEYRECSMQVCPTPAVWSTWSTWSACSSTCGSGGSRLRSRTCNQTLEGIHSLPCLNFTLFQETKDCNRFSCTPNVKSCQEAFDRGLEDNSFVQLSFPGSTQSTKPATVYCWSDGTGRISAIVNSSYESYETVVFNGTQRRNYRLVYSSNNVQMSSNSINTFVYNSKECKQQVSWRCKNFPINSQTGVRFVFWKNQYSDEMAYWGNATAVAAAGNTKPTMCSCGEKLSCNPFKCFCDRNLTTWSEDGGWLENKFDLPLTEIVVMDTGYPQQEGQFSVGPLICN